MASKGNTRSPRLPNDHVVASPVGLEACDQAPRIREHDDLRCNGCASAQHECNLVVCCPNHPHLKPYARALNAAGLVPLRVCEHGESCLDAITERHDLRARQMEIAARLGPNGPTVFGYTRLTQRVLAALEVPHQPLDEGAFRELAGHRIYRRTTPGMAPTSS